MKRSLTFVCILASGFGATALAQASSAAPPASMPSAPVPASAAPATTAAPATSKVAVIQFQQAVAATNEGQRDFAELRKKFEPKQNELKTQSDAIDALKKQLQTQGATLSDSARADLTRQIDEKTKQLQRAAEDAQSDFQTQMGETYQKLAEKVFQVAQSYAVSAGYTLVLDASAQQSPVLWFNQGTDISQTVVDAYNQKSGIPAPTAGTAPSTAPRSTAPARTAPAKPATTPQ